jgi:hypothetical protein
VSRVGLEEYPEDVKLLYLDKTKIRWLQEKDVTCEFIVMIDPEKVKYRPASEPSLRFKVSFYGATGDEIAWEIINIYHSREPFKNIQPEGNLLTSKSSQTTGDFWILSAV